MGSKAIVNEAFAGEYVLTVNLLDLGTIYQL